MCLAWAGIGRLTLVDPDRFQPANIFRHVLGRSGVLTESKVAGLKQEIELKIPELNVFAVNSKIGAALKEDRVKLDGSSLIVVAIGNPTASLALNDTLLSLSGAPPVVFTWLEPYGLGGHALLTNTRIPGASGCFQCLLRDDPELGLVNTADFAAPRQVFGRPDLGCSGAFVPYGDLDARETANLATRLIIDALRGRVPGHVLRSWRGDATDFRNAGFQTSPRYDLENVDKGGHGYCHDDCRFCKGRPA
jgi:molybdopterin/thiamine biosynthesis adenylyltransferase